MKNIFLILTLILCNSTFSACPFEYSPGPKTIAIREKVGNTPPTTSTATPYTDQVKSIAVNRFYASRPAPDKTLVIQITNHEQHQQITEFYGTENFRDNAREFNALTSCSPLTYTDCPTQIRAESVFYVDYASGKKEGFGIEGLGKIRTSLKPIAEKVKRYFITNEIKDCVFLTVFNSETKTSFNTHINYTHFADQDAPEFETFSSALLKALQTVQGSSAKDTLQITLVSSYLGTGMKALYEMMHDYITPTNTKVDFRVIASKQSDEPYLLRKVGAANSTCQLLDKNLSASHIAWTRPIEIYIDTSKLPSLSKKRPGKNIIFDAVTGQHSFF
jgi:hypothetical protein